MSGAIPSRLGYKYQDHCALYFLMSEYVTGADFEIFYSELDEIDFATHYTSKLYSYQAKTNGKLTADSLNSLIKKHQARISGFNKKNGKIILLSETKPQTALQCVISSTPGNRTVERYRASAFTDIQAKDLFLDNKIYTQDEIERLIRDVIDDFLKGLKGSNSYSDDINDLFCRFLLAEIAQISCKTDEKDRSLDKIKMERAISRFIENINWRKEEGRSKDRFASLPVTTSTIKDMASAKIPLEELHQLDEPKIYE